jgi:hypothetical protein
MYAASSTQSRSLSGYLSDHAPHQITYRKDPDYDGFVFHQPPFLDRISFENDPTLYTFLDENKSRRGNWKKLVIHMPNADIIQSRSDNPSSDLISSRRLIEDNPNLTRFLADGEAHQAYLGIDNTFNDIYVYEDAQGSELLGKIVANIVKEDLHLYLCDQRRFDEKWNIYPVKIKNDCGQLNGVDMLYERMPDFAEHLNGDITLEDAEDGHTFTEIASQTLVNGVPANIEQLERFIRRELESRGENFVIETLTNGPRAGERRVRLLLPESNEDEDQHENPSSADTGSNWTSHAVFDRSEVSDMPSEFFYTPRPIAPQSYRVRYDLAPGPSYYRSQ